MFARTSSTGPWFYMAFPAAWAVSLAWTLKDCCTRHSHLQPSRLSSSTRTGPMAPPGTNSPGLPQWHYGKTELKRKTDGRCQQAVACIRQTIWSVACVEWKPVKSHSGKVTGFVVQYTHKTLVLCRELINLPKCTIDSCIRKQLHCQIWGYSEECGLTGEAKVNHKLANNLFPSVGLHFFLKQHLKYLYEKRMHFSL